MVSIMKYHGKLSNDQIYELRAKFYSGISDAKLAVEYKTDRYTIFQIRNHQAYNHVGNLKAPIFHPLDKATREIELRNRMNLR